MKRTKAPVFEIALFFFGDHHLRWWPGGNWIIRYVSNKGTCFLNSPKSLYPKNEERYVSWIHYIKFGKHIVRKQIRRIRLSAPSTITNFSDCYPYYYGLLALNDHYKEVIFAHLRKNLLTKAFTVGGHINI